VAVSTNRFTTLAILSCLAAAPAQGGAASPPPSARAAEHVHGTDAHTGPPRAPDTVRGPDAAASLTPTATFDAAGTLFVVFVEGTRVYVTSSPDLGRTFTPAAVVNPEPEAVDANGEARPKIAAGPKGEIYVSYTHKLEKPYTGDVRFSRSTDGGRTFAAPRTVNDDGLVTGHRFDALAVSPAGDVHVFWIDKRDLERAAARQEAYEGAALYTAVSTDRGGTFSANRKLKDHICECCRLAVAWQGGEAVLFWRDLMEGGVRDHALARLTGDGIAATQRATEDGWQIQGCPHHGPSFAIGPEGTLHLAWFTGDGTLGKGTFYRRSTDGGRTFSAPHRLGTEGATTGRPQVLTAAGAVWLSWREALDDDISVVYAARSTDAGATWSPRREIARTQGENDHPLLIARGDEAYLSWFTRREGYRVLAVDAAPSAAAAVPSAEP